MSKTYILQHDFDWFGSKIPAGTRYAPHGKDYWWPVINDAHCPSKQIDFMTIMNNPEWFKEVTPEENKPKYSANFLWGFSNDSVETLGYEFANAKTEAYQKECWDSLLLKIKENKTTDSFQWDDDLVKELLYCRFPFPEGITSVQPILDEFKKDHTPKGFAFKDGKLTVPKEDAAFFEHSPDNADNKPDWEIVAFEKNNFVYSITNNGLYDTDDLPFTDRKSKEDLIRGGYQIRSVKRSDGITFSVDEITDGGNRINAFELIGDVLQVHMTPPESSLAQKWVTNIQSLVKKRHWMGPPSPFDKAIWADKSKPEKERIEVISFENTDLSRRLYAVSFQVPIKHKDKFPLIKQAIEQVLNDEKFNLTWQQVDFFGPNGEKLYTQKQVDAMCEEVWDAARAKTRGNTLKIEVYKYEDIEDYKKSKP